MERNLRIVEAFLRHSKLHVNANKCRALSYVLNSDKRRDIDASNFVINGEMIPNISLADSIEYLGTSVTTTHLKKRKEAQNTLKEVIRTTKKIGDSVLSLQQKINAIKTFVIPSVDYTITEGRTSVEDLKEFDKEVRKLFKEHVKSNLPNELFYISWRSGGFALQEVSERSLATKIKVFLIL